MPIYSSYGPYGAWYTLTGASFLVALCLLLANRRSSPLFLIGALMSGFLIDVATLKASISRGNSWLLFEFVVTAMILGFLSFWCFKRFRSVS
jgi:hypothetical protein